MKRLWRLIFLFFFFNDTATTEIYTLSLHDALPISRAGRAPGGDPARLAHRARELGLVEFPAARDRKSTRLNSSHDQISYAVFCLKKKKNLDSDQHARFQTAVLASSTLSHLSRTIRD